MKNSKFRESFEKSPIGILFFDKDGNLPNANQSVVKIGGIPSLEDVIGYNLFNNVDIASIKDELLEKGSINIQAPVDFDYIKKLGVYNPTRSGIIWVDIILSVIDSGFLAQIRDITEKKKAEEALLDNERLFRGIQENNPAGLVILKPVRDNEGKITDFIWTYLNNSAERINRVGHGELLGKRLLHIRPNHDRELFEAYVKVMETGEPFVQEIHYIGDGFNILSNLTMTRVKDSLALSFIDLTDRLLAEEALQASEEMLKMVLNMSLDGISRFNYKKGLFDYLSPAVGSILGYSVDELLYMDEAAVHAMVHPDDVPGMLAAIQHLEKTGEAIAEYRQKHKNGKYVWLSNHMSIVRDDRGNPIYRYGNIRDITENKKSEEALRESESRFRAVLDNTRDVIIRFNFKSGIYDFFSPSVYDVAGYSPDELINTDLKNGLKMIHPDDLAIHNEATERSIEVGYAEAEYRQLHKNGEYIWLSNRMSTIKDSSGKPLYRISDIRDITESKKAEEALKHVNERMNIASQAAMVGIWDWDIKTDFIEWNPMMFKIFGLDPENSVASFEAWDKALHPDDIEISHKRVEKAIEEHTYLDSEYRIVKPDGEIRWINALGNADYDEEGHPLWMTGICIDITERKKFEEALKEARDNLEEKVEKRTVKLEEMNVSLKENELKLKDAIEELKSSNKELQNFAHITSHDLQEPLRSVASYAQLLQRRYKGQLDSDADDFIEFMVDGAIRMKAMIQGLLEYSRIDRTGEEFVHTDMNIKVEKAKTNLLTLIKESQAEITHDELPVVHVGPHQMERVFQNLIGNAIKFKNPQFPPRVHISAKKQDKEWVFSVEDNGIGMDPQYSDKIFEVFKRLHTSDEYEGTGIGLSIVKKIIESNGGRIWFESEFGFGSTFYFTLPIH